MSRRKLVILGAGDLGREILYAAREGCERFSGCSYEGSCFIDEDPEKLSTGLEGLKILSYEELPAELCDRSDVICAVGSPADREKMVRRALEVAPQASFARVIHSSAVLMPGVELGAGTFVAPGATIAIASKLADHVLINQGALIGHDCSIGDFSVICPGVILSGRTQISAGAFLGSGALTYPGVRIGRGCTASALATLSRHLKDGKKAIAKPNLMIID